MRVGHLIVSVCSVFSVILFLLLSTISGRAGFCTVIGSRTEETNVSFGVFKVLGVFGVWN